MVLVWTENVYRYLFLTLTLSVYGAHALGESATITPAPDLKRQAVPHSICGYYADDGLRKYQIEGSHFEPAI